uniref:Uncharacterized protein n=1 Tax=Helianthus annuus TaxID=4232 RepID=A0A251VJ82_HELAN
MLFYHYLSTLFHQFSIFLSIHIYILFFLSKESNAVIKGRKIAKELRLVPVVKPRTKMMGMERPFKRRPPRKQHRRQRVAVMPEVIKAPRNNTTS